MPATLISCNYAQPDVLNARKHPLQAHAHHELLLVVRGRYRAVASGRPIEAEAGTFVVYPAGTVHQPGNRPDRSATLIVLIWSGEAPVLPIGPHHDCGGRLQRLLDLLADTRGESGAALRAILLSAVLAELAVQQAAQADADQFDRIRSFLDGFPHLDLTLEVLCQRFGLGRTALVRGFRARFGLAPMHHLQQVRARLACRLLQDPAARSAEVARAVGLATVPALCRLLRRATGLTIQAARRQGRH